jgi:hypothetical protein
MDREDGERSAARLRARAAKQTERHRAERADAG